MKDIRPLSAATAALLTLDTDPWLSCDDCFERVDRHVESLVSGTSDLPADFRAHLLGCSACFDEARSLVALAAQENGHDPEPALSRFDSATRMPSANSAPDSP